MDKQGRIRNVLFLCTGNSARSILAEAIVNNAGDRRFRAYSAGSRPAGRINPLALELLARLGYDPRGLRSKSWEEFSGPGAPGAPAMDFVFTVCDSAARESCPAWPGHPLTAHWGLTDPVTVAGTESEKRRAFEEAHRLLSDRIRRFLDLPFDSCDTPGLRRHIAEIGRT